MYGEVTVNGKKVTAPGEAIGYSHEKADHLAFALVGEQCEMGTLESIDLSGVKGWYKELRPQLMNCMVAGLNVSQQTDFLEGQYVKGINEIAIRANGTSLQVRNAVLSARSIVLVGNTVTVESCFLEDCDFVTIEILSETSLIKGIRIEFAKDAEFRMIQGTIHEDGRVTEPFIAVGAESILIWFNKSAFETK